MQQADLAHDNTTANEVKVDLDVLGALVLGGANIIAEHNRSCRRWSMKLVEELANSTGLSNDVTTTRYSASGTRDRVLPLQRP
jgi:hypothetical protein